MGCSAARQFQKSRASSSRESAWSAAPTSFSGTHFQVKSTSAIFAFLLMPVMETNSRRAVDTRKYCLPTSLLAIRSRKVSTPIGVKTTSQHGGGTTAGGHLAAVPLIHPACCRTRYSGERYSLLEITPIRSQNSCTVLKLGEAAMRSAARRRVRKSRGEQPASRHKNTRASGRPRLCINLG